MLFYIEWILYTLTIYHITAVKYQYRNRRSLEKKLYSMGRANDYLFWPVKFMAVTIIRYGVQPYWEHFLFRRHWNFHGHYYCQVHHKSLQAIHLCWHPPNPLSVTISYLISLIMPSLPFDKLDETNYNDWKIQMEALLEEKGLFGIVSGQDIMPTTGLNSKGVKNFLEKQLLACSKIILAIHPSQLPHVRNKENSSVIWKNLSWIHCARGLGVLLTLCTDFLKMSMPSRSTITSYVASIHHAAYRLKECYQAEDDSIQVSDSSTTTKPPIISDLNMISVLLNGLPPAYQSVIVNITGTSRASLTFKDVVTRLMNEEGRLRNVISTQAFNPPNEAYVATSSSVPQWKGNSSKFTASKDKSKIICHKCGGFGHICPQCPTSNADAANIAELAVDKEDHDDEQAHTTIVDEFVEEW